MKGNVDYEEERNCRSEISCLVERWCLVLIFEDKWN